MELPSVDISLYEGICPNYYIPELKHLGEPARLSRMIRQLLPEADTGPGTPEVCSGGLVTSEIEAKEWISFIREQFPKFRSVIEATGMDTQKTMVAFWRGVRIPGYRESQTDELIEIFESAGFVPNPILGPNEAIVATPTSIWRRNLVFHPALAQA